MTLTATPIPRTLQMAMSSVRDFRSSIRPRRPPGHQNARSALQRETVREAILRELGRGGQSNFVQTGWRPWSGSGPGSMSWYRKPRMVMAHGQMDPKLLEAVMLKFSTRKRIF